MKSLQDYTKPLLSGAETPHNLMLAFPKLVIEVRSNSAELVDWLQLYFREFTATDKVPSLTMYAIEAHPLAIDLPLTEKPPDPGKSRVKEAWTDLEGGRVVHKVLTGMVFFFGNDIHLAYGPCVKNNSQVVNFINNRLIQHHIASGSLLYHAAGVNLGKRGVAICGFSGAGKSSLALRMMQEDERFVSNDRMMVRRERDQLTMVGVPKQPRVNPGTLLSDPRFAAIMASGDRARFAALPENELWQLEHKYDLLIHRVFGSNRFVLSSPMSALFVLNWTRTGEPLRVTETTAAERPDLLPAFMKSPGVFYQPLAGAPTFTESEYVEQLKDCPLIELSGGLDFDRAATLGAEWLRGVYSTK